MPTTHHQRKNPQDNLYDDSHGEKCGLNVHYQARWVSTLGDDSDMIVVTAAMEFGECVQYAPQMAGRSSSMMHMRGADMMVLEISTESEIDVFTADQPPDGIQVKPVRPSALRFGGGAELAIALTSGIASGVAANWLWNRISLVRGGVSIELDGKRVAKNLEAIRQALEQLAKSLDNEETP